MKSGSLFRSFKYSVIDTVQRVLGVFDYRIIRTYNINYFIPLLYFKLRQTDRFTFIQIGANDGKVSDPIYDFVTKNHNKVSGIAIEPLKDFYEQLKYNYRQYPNIIPLNIAIHATEKEMVIYRVDPRKEKSLPKWKKGIASFNKNHHTLSGTSADDIITEKVVCKTFADVVREHNIGKLDLLQIDTEGYDAEIILSIDFDSVKPDIIHFEHGLPSGTMSPETFQKVSVYLHKNGYDLIMEQFDAIAYRIDSLLPSFM